MELEGMVGKMIKIWFTSSIANRKSLGLAPSYPPNPPRIRYGVQRLSKSRASRKILRLNMEMKDGIYLQQYNEK